MGMWGPSREEEPSFHCGCPTPEVGKTNHPKKELKWSLATNIGQASLEGCGRGREEGRKHAPSKGPPSFAGCWGEEGPVPEWTHLAEPLGGAKSL